MYLVPIGSGLGEIRGLTFFVRYSTMNALASASPNIRVSESGTGQTARD
jgi:hypothetical protein